MTVTSYCKRLPKIFNYLLCPILLRNAKFYIFACSTFRLPRSHLRFSSSKPKLKLSQLPFSISKYLKAKNGATFQTHFYDFLLFCHYLDTPVMPISVLFLFLFCTYSNLQFFPMGIMVRNNLVCHY